MTYEIRAIFENGVLRPLEPLILGEHELVTVVVRTKTVNGQQDFARDIAEPNKALIAAIEKANRLPIESPDDGFSGADHDLVLYSWKK